MERKAIRILFSFVLAIGLLPAIVQGVPGQALANTNATYALAFDSCQAPIGICAYVGGAGYSYESRSQTTAQAEDALYIYVVTGTYNINGVDYSCDDGQTWQALDAGNKSWGMINGSKKEIVVYSFEMPEAQVRIRGNVTDYATVSAQQAEHGQITLSRTTGKAGTAAYVTATPENGYFLSSLVCVSPEGQETDIMNTMCVVFPSSGQLTVRALFKSFSNNADVEIANAQEYVSFANRVNAGETFVGKIVRLTADIDISDYQNLVVGDKFSNPFMGQFDGAGHALTGVTLTGAFNGNQGDTLYAAPFGCIKNGASINNLCVQGTIAFDITSASAATSSYACAGIVGSATSGNVTNCTSKVKITLSSDDYTTLRAGGIVASASNSVINTCSNKGSITLNATGTVKDGPIGAGIVASAYGVNVTECLNTAKVKGFTTSAGIAGCVAGNSTSVVSLCANKAKISAESLGQGKAMAAGIVADADTSALSISNCYNTADISAGDVANEKQGGVAVVAGIAGYDAQVTCTLENCYNTGSVKRVGTNEDATYRIGDIAPLINIIGNDYGGFKEEEAAAIITKCYGSSDTFSAADLGSNWRDDAEGGSPLLTWEPADATNVKLPVPATSVVLSEVTLALEQYDALTLSATVEPEDTTDTLAWSSSNDAVATVTERGVVSAVDAGTCTITATAGEVSASCEVSVTACEDTPLYGGVTVSRGGTYKLAGDAQGTITIDTEDAVVIRGMGADKNRKYKNSIYFDCTQQASKLTLCDMYLSNTGNTNLVNFAGQGNELVIEGTCVLDYTESDYGTGGDALVHVPQGASLRVTGTGTLYAYKSSAGALFGGDGKELNGNITFALTGSMFAKGTRQGAVIGSGAESAKAEGIPGSVTFESGTYNLISNSRGAVIGGAAGSSGASSGTEVYVHGGSININCDYSGSAVGGGGYKDGNDSSGGTLYITGGSFRTYVDKNVATNVGDSSYYKGLPLTEGINNTLVTAERKNEQGKDVFLCVVDTQGIEPNDDGAYEVTVDGQPFYTGKLHEYAFLNEAVDRGDGSVDTSVDYTPKNWVTNEDSCLYLYLTGTSHTIEVNGQTIEVVYNAASLGTAAETNGGSFTAPYTLGDVNNNGHLNIVDAQITYDLVTGVYANEQGDYAAFPLPEGWSVATLLLAADANESGTLEAADAFAIQYAALHNGIFAPKE